LRWIQANIGEFGGDPGNVTVFGQSGGGAKVNYLLLMPSAKELFHRAVLQSPGTLLSQGNSPERSAEIAKSVLDELGISTGSVDKIDDVSDERLAGAALTVLQRAKGAFEILPTVDGELIPEAPASSSQEVSRDVPILLGET
jgi:para-nitrobenzyl esterase